MKVLVCENNSSGTNSPFMVTDCLGKILTSQSARLRKSLKKNKISPLIWLIRRQVVWRKYFEQKTEKQHSFKTCTESPQKKTPPIYGNCCSLDQKTKNCPNKAGMNRL